MQPSEENVATCVTFCTTENQDFQKGNHARNRLMLLQNVSARVWQNLVAFSSVVKFFLIEGPVCGRRQPFQDWTEQPAVAVAGSNGIYIYI